MSNIYCGISNCHYWHNGNVCKASKILITADEWAAQVSDDIDAPLHNQVPAHEVETCMDTCCKTFVPKGSPQYDVDGVIRN